MHYFSPVHRMPLLELVVAPQTNEQSVATARECGIRQGKTVIVVKDGPGFYTSRILSPFLNEAMLLLAEGATVDAIDRAVTGFGFPVGPLALLDEVGIDVAAHVARHSGDLYAERGLGASDALPRLDDAGLKGRKAGQGFYRYPPKGKKSVNEEVYGYFEGRTDTRVDAEQIALRCASLMVNEAVYCLQETVIGSARDGDIGAVMGLGFPPFLGGPFHYLDSLGARGAVEQLERLRDAHGPRFEPAPLLREQAASGARFHG